MPASPPQTSSRSTRTGTSTPLNDVAEAAAVASVFADAMPPMTSTKGVTGHALGAAGALEAIAALLSMEHRLIPATANTTEVLDEVGVSIWSPAHPGPGSPQTR